MGMIAPSGRVIRSPTPFISKGTRTQTDCGTPSAGSRKRHPVALGRRRACPVGKVSCVLLCDATNAATLALCHRAPTKRSSEHVQTLRPVTEVRSTLASSIGALPGRVGTSTRMRRGSICTSRCHPRSEPPLRAFPDRRRNLPHYDACDRLGLSVEEMQLIGWSVGAHIETTFLNALAKGAQALGVTPWKLLGNFQRLWARVLQNGSVAVTKTGPKDGIVEVRGVRSLASSISESAARRRRRSRHRVRRRSRRPCAGGEDLRRRRNGEISVEASWV